MITFLIYKEDTSYLQRRHNTYCKAPVMFTVSKTLSILKSDTKHNNRISSKLKLTSSLKPRC